MNEGQKRYNYNILAAIAERKGEHSGALETSVLEEDEETEEGEEEEERKNTTQNTGGRSTVT